MQEMLPIASGLLLGGLLAANRLPVYVRVLLILTLAHVPRLHPESPG